MFMSDGREEIEVLDINILALYMVYYVQTARLIHEVNGREGLGVDDEEDLEGDCDECFSF